jgi:hypothetical protein
MGGTGYQRGSTERCGWAGWQRLTWFPMDGWRKNGTTLYSKKSQRQKEVKRQGAKRPNGAGSRINQKHDFRVQTQKTKV